MTGFRTRKGVVLLYDPEPLDAWINREIEETEEGEYVDTDTSKALTKQEGPQYRAFLQRHESRNEDARQADKLFHIVDKYLPLQADETRAGARFPARARTLLPKARKIRNRPRCGKGRDPTTRGIPSKGDSTRTTTSPGEDLLPLTEKTTHCGIERATTMSRKDSRLREGETIPTTKDAPSQGDSSRPAAEVRGGLPPPAERADVETEERATTVSRKDSRLREGTKDAPSQGDSSRPAAELHGELPPPAERADVETEHANMEGKGSPPPDGDTPPDWGDDSQTDDDITHSNWPWGEQGRPSDHGRSEGVLGQQPDEPVGRIQLEESCGRSADKVKLQDVIQEKGFPLCVSVNDAKMDGESLNILKHGWGYTCPVSTVGLFNKCYEVKCEKKSAKEMGQHVMDGLSHHAGNLMGALSGALTGDDQKDKKMFKEEDKPDMDLGATAKSAWASMLSDDKEKDVCVGGRKVHVWKVTE
ncbi:hypothetical protein AK812_SmicGene15603 [Symbiodinium microadriaticum]|uniref:Uncharacterized protein n=1 Tax=Symbiodinium microadriaticum TaxID=2951 RepID=A0A1Q9E2J3_SYMMI|nr:hypothetical protein AK812_SmicGene15603 [Symbiodinium microadriaticum]